MYFIVGITFLDTHLKADNYSTLIKFSQIQVAMYLVQGFCFILNNFQDQIHV